jgi:sigma-E factor negative regulatory protein RseA
MSDRSLNDDDKRERLSALLDGECSEQAVRDACAAWRDDAGVRSAWHEYNLIGDVLRCDDLAHPAPRDALFLAALRARLAQEPVVLAPAREAAAPARHPRRWLAPAAAAAGFVAVAGVLVVTRLSAPDGDAGPVFAGAPNAALQPVAASMPLADANEPQPIVADGKLIRDARLDRYLAAHKRFGDSSAVAVPGVVLRSSATVAPAR